MGANIKNDGGGRSRRGKATKKRKDAKTGSRKRLFLPVSYWKSSLNMAQSEAGAGDGERNDERLLLNTFPNPTRAMQIKERMSSFFIVQRR